jgi:hypothetical protein
VNRYGFMTVLPAKFCSRQNKSLSIQALVAAIDADVDYIGRCASLPAVKELLGHKTIE